MSGHPVQAAQAEPFYPSAPPSAYPLWTSERRPWTARLIDHCLRQYTQPGDLVVDPFAAQAGLGQAAGAARRRTILSNFSPASLLGVLASADPPLATILDGAFGRIADAPRRGQTLAHYLRGLYETVCPECAQMAVATYYVWDRDAGEPVEKAYTCTHCQSHGRAPADMADADQAAGLELRGAAYWGLLSRLVAPGDPLTGQARELLDLYTPRSLLAISELVIAAEQRLKEPEQQRSAKALILHVLEQCISLHSPPEGQEPFDGPRSGLQPPPRFVEHNAWLAFEQAHRTLRSRPPGRLRPAPDLSSLLASDGDGRVLVQSYAVQDLAERLEPGSVALVLTEPPAFDPAAYTLGFLWTGWLYGREAASRLKSTLTIDNWSWDWYARAMTTSFRSLRKPVMADGHLVLAFEDQSSRRALALLAAATLAGWQLAAQATQSPMVVGDSEPAWRLVFTPSHRPVVPERLNTLTAALQETAHEAARGLLDIRAEPAPQALLRMACAVAWAETGRLAQVGLHAEASRRPVSCLVEQFRQALSPDLPPAGLRFVPAPGGKDPGLDRWAPEQAPEREPLADRVEAAVAELMRSDSHPAGEVEALTYERFPGWETPDAALVAACCSSYGRLKDGRLHLRDEDLPERRAREHGEMLLRLHDLGHRLGFEVWVAPWEQSASLGLVPLGQGQPDDVRNWAPAGVVWHETGQPAYAFAFVERAAVHPWLLPPPEALGGCPRYVVLPGGRAELLDFKLRRCPEWRLHLAETGWEFVKYRHVRDLAAMPDLNLAGFRARIGLDPIVALPGKQLALFDTPSPGDDDAE